MNNTEKAMPKKKKLPIFAIVFLAVGVISLIFYISFLFSERFSDFFNQNISSLIRAALSYATVLIPFSFAEFLLILSPFIFVGAVIYGTVKYTSSWRDVIIFCISLLSVIALILSIFALGFAPAYRGTRLDEKLSIDRRDVSADELYQTASLLSEMIAKEEENIIFNPETNFSVMPYSYDEMNKQLMAAFDKACDKYDFLQRLNSRVKPVMLSELMSYTHITGVYTFFTGEANINVAFPDYTIPYTAAHELCHQRGIAREDEANFMAFLVCCESDDAYIRYSGYVELYSYVLSALRTASYDLYKLAIAEAVPSTYGELIAYSSFFNKYRDSVAGEVSGTVNNTFLTIHGTEGTKSYGMVVDLAVAYFIPKNDT